MEKNLLEKIGDIIQKSLIFLLYFIISQVTVLIMGIILNTTGKITSTSGLFLLYIAILNVLILLYLAKKQGVFRFQRDFWQWKNIFKAFGGVIAVWTFNIILSNLTAKNTDDTSNQKALFMVAQNVWQPAFFVIVGLMAPIMEEIVFRGLIIGKFLKKTPLLGLLISSVLFGLGHTPDSLYALFAYSGMGMIFGLFYYFNKRLEISIMIHIINNSISVLLMYLS